MPLCRRCHDAVHASQKLKQLLASELTSDVKRQTVIGFLAGRDEALSVKVVYPAKQKSRKQIDKELRRNAKKRAYYDRNWIRPNDYGGLILLNRELIRQCRTFRGGYTKATITAFGLTYPLEHHWERRLVGTVITLDKYRRAYEGRIKP